MSMRRRLILFLLGPVLAAACAADGESAAPATPPESTYEGMPAAYPGDERLLVVTWADWASVWPLTRNAVAEYRTARPDVDVRYVNADSEPTVVRWLGSDVVPTVFVVHGGRIVASQGNVATAEDVAALVAQAEAAP